MSDQKYKLVTRSDMDGLVSAILLKQLDMIEDILFVHPKDVQDGKVPIDQSCITTNLPYNENAHLAFDHHASEIERIKGKRSNLIMDPKSPSTARVVYNYFGGKMSFPTIALDMLAAVDKADSAQYTYDDVVNPKGWELLSFLMDARTGLGRFKEFKVSNYNLMMQLIDYCRNHTIDDILKLPDVRERVDLYFAHQEKFKEQIKRCSSVYKRLVVLELRKEEVIYAGNRFMIYAIFPESSISMHVMWGLRKQNTVFAVGKSIFKRDSSADLGGMMLEYGGGGHESAATCQIGNDKAELVKAELIKRLAAAS